MRRRIFGTVAIFGVVIALGTFGTFAAFTATTTNSGNQIQSGTVALSDNDSGQAMYQATNQKPGDSVERCIKVTYDGSLDAVVSLYASSVGALGADIDLTITPGTATGSFPSCTGFTADAGGAIYTGTLKGFADIHSGYRAGLADNPASSQRWQSNQTVAYRLLLTVRDDTAPNTHTSALSTGAHAFTWEARDHAYAQTVLDTPGILSYWRLGEQTGTSAQDAKGTVLGSHNNGVSVGTLGAMPNDPDKSAAFDGVDDYVLFSVSGSLDIGTGSKSWELWYRTPNSTSSTLYRKSDAGNANGVLLLQRSDGLLACRIDLTTSGLSAVSGSSYADGQFHHVVCVLDRPAGELRLYVDGAQVGTRDVSALAGAGLDASGASRLGGSSLAGYLTGELDDAAVYSTAMTAAQIKSHYDAR